MKRFFILVCLYGLIVHLLCAEDIDLEYVIRKKIHLNSPIQNIRYSPDGEQLAVGLKNGQVVLCDLKTAKPTRRFMAHAKTVNEVTYSPSGRFLASAGADGLVNVWDLEKSTKVATYRGKNYLTRSGQVYRFISFVDFSKDEKYVYFGGDSGYIMCAEIGKRRRAKVIYSSNLSSGDWYSSITGGTISEEGNTLIFCVGKEVHQIDLRYHDLKQKLIYAKSQTDKELHFNDVVEGPFPNGVTTWTYDGRVSFWDLSKGKKVSSIQVTENQNYSAASFDKTYSYMVTGASGKVAKVWDVKTRQLITSLQGHTQKVQMVRFHPINRQIATASLDGTVLIWGNKPKVKTDTLMASNHKASFNQIVSQEDQPPYDRASKWILFQEELIGKGEKVNLKEVRFAQGSYILKPKASAQLQSLVRLMQQYKNMKIRLEGHTDNIGDPNKNRALALRRVLAAKNYMITKGIYETRIEIKAYGGENPIINNDTEENRKKNRRIELEILEL